MIDIIRSYLADPNSDSVYSLMNADYESWVFRFDDGFGVLIPYNGPDVNEEFANVKLYSTVLFFNGKKHRFLALSSSLEKTRNEFAVFCNAFVDPGQDGYIRKQITSNPVEWWKNWKQLLGNVVSDQKPYSVIGEMLFYIYALKNNAQTSWGGPNSNSHDIISLNCDYEVKSTINKYSSDVHISSQFQLRRINDKPLKLCFVRFEENISGISINDCTQYLKKLGVPEIEIVTNLRKTGYVAGSSVCNQKYGILESYLVDVDEKFPHINFSELLDCEIAKYISKIEYDVNLAPLKNMDNVVDFNEILKNI